MALVARFNPKVKAPPRKKKPQGSRALTDKQKEDIKNIKLDEVSAKWICPFKGKNPGEEEEGEEKEKEGGGGENGEEGGEGEIANVKTEQGGESMLGGLKRL